MHLKTILLPLCLMTAVVNAQQNRDAATVKFANKMREVDSTLASLQLDTLGGKIITRYSKNYILRAKTLQSIIGKCAIFYERNFPNVLFTVQLMILNKQDWNKLSVPIPYGMPASLVPINKLLIAADKNAVAELFGQTETLPDNQLSKFDYIALHELGHNFLLRLMNTDANQKWANEFLASYFAICYLEESKSKQGMPQIDQTNFQPKYKTLEDFEKLYSGVGPQNYAWYQGKFQELGYSLYPKFKLKLIKEFIANYKTTGKKLNPVDLLKQLAPDIMNKFLAEMK